MGLTNEITVALQSALDTDLADAVTAIDIVYTKTYYDQSLGKVANVETIVTSRAVISQVDKSMVDGEVIVITDKSFTILKTELSTTPEIGNKITADGIDYSVNAIIIDPADVAWNVIGRAV